MSNHINGVNSQGRYEEALKLGLDCKQSCMQLEQESLLVQITMAEINRCIATSYARLGNFDEAEPLAREALESLKRNLGENRSLECATLLAWILREKGNEGVAEAEEIEQRVLDSWKDVVGEKDLRTVEAMKELAKTYRRQDRDGDAKALEEQAEELRRDIDLGLRDDKEKDVDEIVARALRQWDENQKVIFAAMERLKLA